MKVKIQYPATLTLEETNDTMRWVELRVEGQHTARITCRVCEASETVSVGHPALLCSHCLEDLGATARHVADVYAAALAYFQEAMIKMMAEGKSSPECEWWLKVDRARADGHPNFPEAWHRAKTNGGEKARLCALWEALEKEASALEPINTWYAGASRELAAARAARGEPANV